MTDNSTDEVVSKNPSDYLAPITGQVPWAILIGIYLIAAILLIIVLKSNFYE